VNRSNAAQLGFHVNRNAVITDVEPQSAADVAGLKPFSRLVRICGSDVAAMSHEQTIDLLRSSASVILTVVPPQDDGLAQRFVPDFIFHDYLSSVLLTLLPHAGYGVIRIDPLCFLARCHKRQLNQALSISLSIVFLRVFCAIY